MDKRVIPKLEYRDMLYSEIYSKEGQIWGVRNRINGFFGGKVEEKYGGRYYFKGNLVHSYISLMHESGMKIKPEMWSLVNGKRMRGQHQQPCLTNPDVLKAMVAGVKKRVTEHPESEFVVVGQNDNRNYCRCKECQPLIDKEGRSGPVIQFANQVAAEVEKEFPNIRIMTPAYQWSRHPPKTLKPRHNVLIVLCSIECDFNQPLALASTRANKRFKKDIETWSRITSKLFIWDYVTNFKHFLMPHPNLDVLVPNIKYFVDNKVAGIFSQGSHTGMAAEFTPLRMWILAQAKWNPEADGKRLLSDFLHGYYGPATYEIGYYIDTMHKLGREKPYRLRTYALMDAPFLEPETIGEAEVKLQAAERLVKYDSVYARRVRHAHMPILYILGKKLPGSLTWEKTQARVNNLDLKELADKFTLVVKESGVTADADGNPLKPWMEWLNDYAALYKKNGTVLPPELKGKDPQKSMLVQACQMDQQSKFWKKTEGATDGWAAACNTNEWFIRHMFTKWDNIVPGKKYKLFIRVKGTATGKKGKAISTGISGNRRGKYERYQFDVSQISASEFKALEVGEYVFNEKGGYFWFALTKKRPMPMVYLDCLWLEQID
jgi:hypothetical protein